MTDGKLENSQKLNEGGGITELDPRVETYLLELLKEKHTLNTSVYPHASRLMQEEVQKTKAFGRVTKESKYADVYKERPIKVVVKVAVPVKEHPKFNFVGKLLGPRGNSLKRLQEETMCKMSILGRGSMKDKGKEEELRKSLDPKYAHLSDDLHIEISTSAPPAEAHARMAYALAEIRKFLIPDCNDDISMEQLREMENYLEPSVPGTEEEPSEKKPSMRLPRSSFRGGVANHGASTRKYLGTFSSGPATVTLEEPYTTAYSRASGEERLEDGHSFPRFHTQTPVSCESVRGRWKNSSMSGLPRFISRSTPYFRPNLK